MRARHPLPALWLLSDVRNDGVLERALRRLPRGSGFVFRHYHLPARERRARFQALLRLCRARGHFVVLADSGKAAQAWGADGIYGPPTMLRPRRAGMMALATAHALREIGGANRMRADALLLSPVFPTRSHPDPAVLGPVRFRPLARRARAPVIALGGMNAARARQLRWPCWAAIDGLSTGAAGGAA